MLVFVIRREKYYNSATLSLTVILTLIPQQIDQINLSDIVER